MRGVQFFETETGFFEQRLLQDELGAGLDGLAYQHLGVGKAGLQIGCARHPDGGKVPDRNTVWAFRERLVQAGLGTRLFGEMNRQRQGEGDLARYGQIINDTLVPVPTRHNGRIAHDG